MASQVLSGASNPSYTNNTGQNVRVVINYIAGTSTGITLSWAGVSISAALRAIGRNLATSYIEVVDPPNTIFGGTATTYSSYGLVSNNNALPINTTVNENYPIANGGSAPGTKTTGSGALPTEIMLAPGQTFSATSGAYNIVVIPEAG